MFGLQFESLQFTMNNEGMTNWRGRVCCGGHMGLRVHMLVAKKDAERLEQEAKLGYDPQGQLSTLGTQSSSFTF